MRLLILGGTTEASKLAHLLAFDPHMAPVLSLAGRTRTPVLPPVPHRIGGFGGVDGLTRWLGDHATELVVDATHPFALRISANAVAATSRVGLPLITILRPAWQPVAGDRWHSATDATAAAELLGKPRFRQALPATPVALLTMGRLDLAAFADLRDWRLVVRSIDPPDELPVGAQVLLDRGPYTLEAERAVLTRTGADVLVTKNSGGEATVAKLVAARQLGVPVIMIERQWKPTGQIVADVETALARIQMHHVSRRSARGV